MSAYAVEAPFVRRADALTRRVESAAAKFQAAHVLRLRADTLEREANALLDDEEPHDPR